MTEASGTNRGGIADGSEPAVANEVHDMTYLVQGTRCFNEVLPPPVTVKAANEGWMICGTPKKLPDRLHDPVLRSDCSCKSAPTLHAHMHNNTNTIRSPNQSRSTFPILQINHAARLLFCMSLAAGPMRPGKNNGERLGFSWQGTLPKGSMKSMCRPIERKRVEPIRKYRHMSLK